MSDANQTLKLLVEWGVINADQAEKAQKTLDAMNQSAREGTGAHEALGKSTEEAGEKTGEFGEKLLHNRHLMLETNKLAPELGHVLRDAFEGPVGAVGLLALGLVALKEKMGATAEAQEKLGEEARTGPFIEGIKAQTEAINKGIESLENYANAQQTITVALQGQLAAENALAAARAARIKDEATAAAAEVNRKAKAGELTPEQAELQRTTAAIQAAKDEAAAKTSDAQKQIDTKQADVDKARKDQPGLDAAQQAAVAQAAKLHAHDAAVAGFGGPDADKERLAAEDAATAARKEAEQLQNSRDPAWIYRPRAAGYTKKANGEDVTVAEAAEEDAQRAEEHAQRLNQGYAEYLRTTGAAHKSTVTAADNAATNATQDATKNADFIAKTQTEIDQAKANLLAVQGEAAKDLAIKIAAIISDAETKLYDQPHGAEVKGAVQEADFIEKVLRVKAAVDAYDRNQLTPEAGAFLMKFVNEHGGQASTAEGAAGFARGKYGTDLTRETTPITTANASQFSEAERYLVLIAQNLGGHVQSIKEAADFVITLKDNSTAMLQSVATLVTNSYTRQQQIVDQLARDLGVVKTAQAAGAKGSGQ